MTTGWHFYIKCQKCIFFSPQDNVCFIWSPVTIITTETGKTSNGSGGKRLNITWMKLKTLPRLPGPRQTEFIQQWWLFNNRDNNSHESMLLHDIINQRLLFLFVLTERPPLGQKLYCAFTNYQFYPTKSTVTDSPNVLKITKRFRVINQQPHFSSPCLWGK